MDELPAGQSDDRPSITLECGIASAVGSSIEWRPVLRSVDLDDELVTAPHEVDPADPAILRPHVDLTVRTLDAVRVAHLEEQILQLATRRLVVELKVGHDLPDDGSAGLAASP